MQVLENLDKLNTIIKHLINIQKLQQGRIFISFGCAFQQFNRLCDSRHPQNRTPGISLYDINRFTEFQSHFSISFIVYMNL
jgi:hypothetical protein